MENSPIVDKMSVVFFFAITLLSTVVSYHLTNEIWSSLSFGILTGLMCWATYLAFRWIYLSLKK